jgi:uncharacterized protein (TIGR00255 family)
MKSMTGFAKIQQENGTSIYTVEIKTLNSKQLDIMVKMPADLRDKDLEIRTMLNRLERGKIDFTLTKENIDGSATGFNKEVAKAYYNELKPLYDSLGQSTTGLMDSILRRPEVWDNSQDTAIADETWQKIVAQIQKAINTVDETRTHEGEILKTDFYKHVDIIQQKLDLVPQYEAERITQQKDRLRKSLAELGTTVDENRFEQELIYYLEKLDITEEKVRLQKHIDYFRETMELSESTGKKLAFITQEMGREINTMGSKANHTEIQKLVVIMKDELEKIKEQLGNIL